MDSDRKVAWRMARHSLANILGQAPHRTRRESAELGRSLRRVVPRDAIASWYAGPDRQDVIGLLLGQDETRVAELVALRHERLSASPFAFLRGSALAMAADLSSVTTTGIEVQACGDAHIANFGLFSSPERRTVFDLNDFDETTRGPWEWDVARLAASVEVCARERGMSEAQAARAVLAAVGSYREAMRSFSRLGNLDVWYAHLDVDELLARLRGEMGKKERKRLERAVGKAKAKGNARAASRLTEVVDGELRVVSDPPLVVPLRDMVSDAVGRKMADGADMDRVVGAVLAGYRLTLPPERRALLERYRGVDIARKVVGVGSVGTRAWIVVLEGSGSDDALVLQVKEAQESVLERFVGRAAQGNHGQRVVEGQRAIQVASDLLLGWTRLPGDRGRAHDYYVRQLWDGKGSFDLARIGAKGLRRLAGACGWTLAHAHARTGDRFAIAAYLGKSDVFDRAMLSFARTYADQGELDHAAFVRATAGEP